MSNVQLLHLLFIHLWWKCYKSNLNSMNHLVLLVHSKQLCNQSINVYLCMLFVATLTNTITNKGLTESFGTNPANTDPMKEQLLALQMIE